MLGWIYSKFQIFLLKLDSFASNPVEFYFGIQYIIVPLRHFFNEECLQTNCKSPIFLQLPPEHSDKNPLTFFLNVVPQ